MFSSTRILKAELTPESYLSSLLEIQHGAQSKLRPRMNVSYIHRTVTDYLNKREIKETLKSWTNEAENGYDPCLAILGSNVLQLKAKNTFGYSFITAEDCLQCAIQYARRLEADAKTSQFELMEELFTTGYSWAHKNFYKAIVLNANSNALTLAVKYGLHRYLHEKLRREKDLEGPHGKPLLLYALIPEPQYKAFLSAKVVSSLLEFGADPIPIWNKVRVYLATETDTVQCKRVFSRVGDDNCLSFESERLPR